MDAKEWAGLFIAQNGQYVDIRVFLGKLRLTPVAGLTVTFSGGLASLNNLGGRRQGALNWEP